VKLLASIGGAADNANQWLSMARGPGRGETLFRRARRTQITAHHYDGVDIDWSRLHRPTADQQTYTEFMRVFAPALPRWVISTALPAGEWTARHISWTELGKSVDFINLMTYVFAGSWTGHSAHNANLYRPSAYADPNGLDVDSSIESLTTKHGLPKDKIVLGLAFYGTQYSTIRLAKISPRNRDFAGKS